MIQLSLKRFIYGFLYTLPRSIIDLFAALLTILTLGWYCPSLNYYKMWAHSCWADKIAKKYSGLQKYKDNGSDID